MTGLSKSAAAVTLVIAMAAAFGAGYFGWPWFFPESGEFVLKPDNEKIVARGQAVYKQECASCHGVNLQGQPNWRSPGPDGLLPAPPHDVSGHTWHHTDQVLFELTKFGLAKMSGLENHKTNMPVYEGILEDGDIIAALSYIKSNWPKDIRMRHDQMNAQALSNR